MGRKALIRSADGLLLAHGFCDFESKAGESVVEAPEDFVITPREWRWTGSEWLPVATSTQSHINGAARRRKQFTKLAKTDPILALSRLKDLVP